MEKRSDLKRIWEEDLIIQGMTAFGGSGIGDDVERRKVKHPRLE